MEANDKISEEYIKSFNQGYVITKHMPEHAEAFAKALGTSERATGFKDGHEQAKMELSQDRLPDWLRRDRLNKIQSFKPHIRGRNHDPDIEH